MLPTILQLNKIFLFTLAVSATLAAQANPEGGVVTNGSASISSSGNTTTINQSSQQAIVNWNSFNIAKGEKTQFNQPTNGVALNRINPNMGASEIYGQLNANGRIILVNAAGVHFGASANVNVGSIIASTSDISNRNFHHGNYIFDRPSKLAGSIINEGRITTADYGLAALLGTSVLNSGVIRAHLGSIALGAGSKFTLSFTGDDLINFEVNGAANTVGVDNHGNKLKSGVTNTGKLISNGGQILVTANMASNVIDNVIDMRGVAEARSVHQSAGEIILSGGSGNVLVSGILNASGRHHHSIGGLIEVLGKNIKLTATAVLDAVGATGGGNVYIGGNEHGTGPLPDAVTTTIDGGAVIDASALDSGNGGNVIVWSDVLTNYAGDIKATGGEESGNGGFAEVSGHEVLNFAGGTVNLSAANGTEGTLLLDPENVTIQTSGTSSAPITSGVFTPTSSNSILTVADLQAALALSNVNVTTGSTGTDSGDITVANALTWSSSNILTLTAANNIYLNANITAAQGGLVLSAGSPTALITSGSEASPSTTGVTANLNLANFTLVQGNWTQINSTLLPTLSVSNSFVLSGAPTNNITFIRAIGGTGATGNPYQIADVYGLEGIGSNTTTEGDSYVLSNEINASGTTTWNGGAGFAPINNFIGTLNGQYHTINGLFENMNNSVGLFANLNGATIDYLGLTNVNLTGNRAGAIAANATNVTLNYDYVTGTVNATYIDPNGTVSGGLIGYGTAMTISNSYNNAAINSNNGYSGGILGSLNSGSLTNTSSSIGAIRGIFVGGLIGQVGDSFSGALGTITISDSFVSSPIASNFGGTSGSGAFGSTYGYVFGPYASVTVTNSYYDVNLTGQPNAFPTGQYDHPTLNNVQGGCVGGGTCGVDLGVQSTYTGFDFSTPIWNMTAGSEPTLAFNRLVGGTVSGVGSGKTVDIYQNGSLLSAATTNAAGGFSYSATDGIGLITGAGLVYVLTGSGMAANDVTMMTSSGNVSSTLQNDTVIIGDTGTHTFTNSTISSLISGVPAANLLFSISGNTLTLGNGGTTTTINLVTTPTTTYSMGSVNFSNATGSLSFDGPVTLTSSASLTASAITFANTVDGAGTYSLSMNSSANSITGAVSNITSLSLSGGGNDTLSSSVTSSGTQTYNDNLTLSGSDTLTTTNSIINFMGTVNGAASLTLAPGTGAANFQGPIGTTKALTSLSNSGTGVTTIANGAGSSSNLLGSINLAGPASLGGAIYTSGTQIYSGTITLTSNTSLTASSSTIGNVIGNGNTLALNSGTISGVFSDGTGASSLNQNGTGTLTLSGANTFSGATTVNGIISFSGSGSLADSVVTLTTSAASELKLNNLNVAVGGIAGGGSTGGNILLGSGTLTIDNKSANTYAGVVSGTGGLTMSGTNALTLSNNNTFTGATTINGGTLNLTSSNALADSSGVSITGGALQLSNIAASIQSLSLSGGKLTGTGTSSTTVNIAVGASSSETINTVNSADKLTLSGTINGSGSLALQGPGKVILSGAVGNTTKLNSITSTAGSTGINNNVATTGNQTYNGAVVLGSGNIAISVANSASSIAFNGGISGSSNLTLSGSASGSNSYTLAGTLGVTSIVVNGGSGSNNSLTVQSNNAQTFNITSSNVGNVTGANSGTLTFNSVQNLVGGSVSNDFVFANNSLVTSINGTGNSNNKVDNSASTMSLTDTITADNTGTVQLNGSTMNYSHIQNLIGAGSSALVVSESTPSEIVLTGENSGYVNDPTNFAGFTTFIGGGSGATSINFAATPNAILSSNNSAYYINAELTFNNISSFSGNFTIPPPPVPVVSASVSVDQVVSFLNYIPNVINSNNSSTSSVIPAPTQPASNETSIQIDGSESYDGSLITIQYLMPQPTYPDGRKRITTASN